MHWTDFSERGRFFGGEADRVQLGQLRWARLWLATQVDGLISAAGCFEMMGRRAKPSDPGTKQLDMRETRQLRLSFMLSVEARCFNGLGSVLSAAERKRTRRSANWAATMDAGSWIATEGPNEKCVLTAFRPCWRIGAWHEVAGAHCAPMGNAVIAGITRQRSYVRGANATYIAWAGEPIEQSQGFRGCDACLDLA